MLTSLYPADTFSEEANALILVEAGRARPELILAQPARQVIFQRRTIVSRKGVISDNGNISARIFCAQNLCGGYSCNPIADDYILFSHTSILLLDV